MSSPTHPSDNANRPPKRRKGAASALNGTRGGPAEGSVRAKSKPATAEQQSSAQDTQAIVAQSFSCEADAKRLAGYSGPWEYKAMVKGLGVSPVDAVKFFAALFKEAYGTHAAAEGKQKALQKEFDQLERRLVFFRTEIVNPACLPESALKLATAWDFTSRIMVTYGQVLWGEAVATWPPIRSYAFGKNAYHPCLVCPPFEKGGKCILATVESCPVEPRPYHGYRCVMCGDVQCKWDGAGCSECGDFVCEDCCMTFAENGEVPMCIDCEQTLDDDEGTRRASAEFVASLVPTQVPDAAWKRPSGGRLTRSLPEQMTCSICLDPLSSGATKLECGHWYHHTCIVKWLREVSNTCCVCRHEYPGEEAPQPSTTEEVQLVEDALEHMESLGQP